jgi:hypothetical protein
VIHGHAQHRDAGDERVRRQTRARELARERRRLAALIQQPHEYRDMNGRPAENEDVIRPGRAW